MAASAQSYASQFGLGTISGNATATTAYTFRGTTLGLDEHFIDANGLRGAISHFIPRNLAGNRPCSGTVQMQPTAVEWSNLLQWMLGTANASNVYTITAARPTRSVVIDRVTNVWTYATVGVEGFELSGAEDQALDLTLRMVGLDETNPPAAPNTFPALTIDTTTFPFKFTDCVVNCNGTVYNPKEFRLTADFHVDKQRFFNSQTLTGIYPQDLTINFESSFAYAEASALYNVGRAGFSVLITATAGNASLTISLPNVAVPRKSPPVPFRREIMLPIIGQAFATNTSQLEMTATLIPTP